MANIKNSGILYPSRNGISRGYDILGNIAVVKFDKRIRNKEKKKYADSLLKRHKNVRTVLEKKDKYKGILRTIKTKYIAGENTKECLYRENGCSFRFNVETCYFSPRLATERKEIADMVKSGESVLVLFGGVGPYAIVISKLARPKRVVSIELGRECNRYAVDNVKRNKVKVEIIQGNVRKKVPKLKENFKNKVLDASKTKSFQGFDRIVMPRPNLKDSFLDVVLPKIRKNGVIHYYGFYHELEKGRLMQLIEDEARAKRRIKILKIKKAGEIGPHKYRYRADILVN